MKKALLSSFALLSCFASFAQSVPNPGFEGWNSVPYHILNGWENGNIRDIQRFGTPTVTRVPGVTGYGVRVETIVNGPDTSDSYMLNTANPCTDPPFWTGGVPYSQQPTAITGKYRYNLPGNDTALIIVIFRQNGVHIGDNVFPIRGSGSQPSFTSFSFPVTCAGVPDSMIIAIASSNKTSNTGIQNGSFIEVDDLAFSGATQQIPNGDFENWTATSYDAPYNWFIGGSAVSRTTDAHSGLYAIKMETQTDVCGNLNMSGITTGTFTNNGPDGGLPYATIIDTLSGYYKYIPSGADSGFVSIQLTNNNNTLLWTGTHLTTASGYTYFQVPFNAGSLPDSIRIDFYSSLWPIASSNAGSVLYVDDIQLASQPLGINQVNRNSIYSVYPNPANDIIRIRVKQQLPGNTALRIFDASQNVLAEHNFYNAGSELNLPISELASGFYFFELINNNLRLSGKFVKK